MTQIEEESLKQLYKCTQRGIVDTNITDICVLCLVIRNA